MTVLHPLANTGRAIAPPPIHVFNQKYHYRPQGVISRKNYLHEAETEYLRMLDEAVDEVKKLIEEVNKISLILD